jgi:hypothetical protein
MYRYRCEHHTTEFARKNFHRVSKLGKIQRVKGYRFTSARKNNSGQPVQYEYVLVVGEHGSCRFSGLCWGYFGEGPRGLCALLNMLNLGSNDGLPSHSMSAEIAYHAYRGNHDGTDWELKFKEDKSFSFTNKNWTTYHLGGAA